MTDTPIEQIEPLLWHEGQPWSRQTAKAHLDALDKDAEYTKALLAGDMAKVAERAAFSKMAKGEQPGPTQTPLDAGAVAKQQGAREADIHEKRLDVFASHINMSPEMRAQFSRRLATAEQHAIAVRERGRLLADPDFVARIHPQRPGAKPDPVAIDHWLRICQVAAAPVAPADYDWNADGNAS